MSHGQFPILIGRIGLYKPLVTVHIFPTMHLMLINMYSRSCMGIRWQIGAVPPSIFREYSVPDCTSSQPCLRWIGSVRFFLSIHQDVFAPKRESLRVPGSAVTE